MKQLVSGGPAFLIDNSPDGRHSPGYQQVIVMEGPDGCGKTNIGQALSLDRKIPYFKVSSEADNWRNKSFKQALEFDQTYISEFLKQTGVSCVIDRAWPSEWVYSKVYGRETNESILELVDKRFASMATCIVMPLRHDYSKCRKDDLVAAEELPKLHDMYLEFAKWTRCNVVAIYVDGFEDNLLREMEMIREELVFNKKSAYRFFITLDREKRLFEVK